MNKKDVKVNIIGAGVSGLIAAQVLEEYGYSPVIFEKTDSVGGRVKTDKVGDYVLDHGFQVLLDAYPMAKKYLDYEKLNLQYFLPGSVIFKNGKSTKFGDPLRDLSFLLPIITTSIATISDKLKVLQLNRELSKKPIVEIFAAQEQTTLAYLKQKGFSDKIVQHFFKPFFSGIFLEKKLATSSRMFEFVFKMFGEGRACVPKLGIGQIPIQLKNKLSKTKFHFNVAINQVENNVLKQNDLPNIDSDFTIIATEASQLIKNLRGQEFAWKSCYCLYFETESKIINDSIIGLLPKGALINNFHYVSTINGKSNTNKELISVTVVRDQGLHSEKDLILKVKSELSELMGNRSVEFLKLYNIPKALPAIDSVVYDIQPSETQLLDNVFLAGDLTLNGSLNAAMLSGERAAQAVLMKLGEKVDI